MTIQTDKTMREEEATIDSSPNKPDANKIEASAVASPKHYESQPSDEREQGATLLTTDTTNNNNNNIESASSMKSDFRQSLADEAREKERQRMMEDARLQQSKKLLREGISANSDSLTQPELSFLESLLELSGPGASDACATAYQRLLDTDLFWGFAVCAGSAGEVESIPGHGWTAASLTGGEQQPPQPEELEELDDSEEWVKDWVSKGTPPSPSRKKVLTESETTQTDRTTSDISLATKQLISPYALQRHSSVKRLERLELRKRQSSSGGDSNRLYRAHEAGLVVTPGGSARRSLMRMGIDVEKGAHFDEFDPVPNTPSAFEEELAKMDEQDIRKIEKEERTRAYSSGSVVPQSPGCISPFSMSRLRKLYASKQLSFHRQSSSYSRYDSFLSTEEEKDAEPNILLGSSDTDNDADDIRDDETGTKFVNDNEIFRPSSNDRLNNLLINAGLKNPSDDQEYLIADASPTRNFSSTSFNSLDRLIHGGGPSFCEEVVFRDSCDYDDAKSEEFDKSKFPTLPIGEVMEENAKDTKEDGADDPDVSPAKSDVGDLPSKPPTHQRSSTQGIIRSSSILSPKRRQYSRSVSWSQTIIAKEDSSGMGARNESSSSGVSIISFPNLRRAAPLRSDSIGSMNSILSFPSIHMGRPLRSESIGSLMSNPSLAHGRPIHSRQTSFSSVMSATPSLRPANAIRSMSSVSQSSFWSGAPSLPSLRLGQAIRSESIATNRTDLLSWDESDLDESFDRNDGAAWESPYATEKKEHHVVLREASKNTYEGEGIEVENEPSVESVKKARKYRSLVSQSEYSAHSFRSRQSSSNLPIKSLDDSFIIRNVDFKRHSSEILRSLSNEDLYSSHNVQTVNGGSKNYDVDTVTSVCNNIDDLGLEDDEESLCNAVPNAWSVLSDEYSLGYGAGDTLPFRILGTTADDSSCHPHVLSPPLMESLQNFLPVGASEQNYWLKYSMVRDGASLVSLLKHIRGAKNTVLAIETVEGEVFGSFTSSPWRKNWNYYGNGNSFLWRMRRTRSDKDLQHSIIDQAKLESELDVYYWTGINELVQYCTTDMIAIGGGALSDDAIVPSATDEERESPEKSPSFPATAQGGFGLAIDSDMFRATSSSCATFNNPPLSQIHADGSPFEILNLEVWTLTPTHDLEAAENMEMKSLFLDAYSAA